MFSQSIYSAPTIAIILLSNVAAAVVDPELMLMTWPPPALSIPTWRNQEPLNAQAADENLHPAIFHCSYHTPPPNVKRTPFPITGGRVQLNRSGTPWLETYPMIPNSISGTWMMNARYGQLQGMPGIPEDAYHVMGSPDVWHMDEFKPGLLCSDPLRRDFTDVQTGYADNIYPINASQLEGLELTLAVEVFHFYPDQATNYTSAGTVTVHCAYVRLTADDINSPCKPGSDSEQPSPSAAGNPSATGTAALSPANPTGTGTGTGSGSGNDSSHAGGSSRRNVIIAAAATSGVVVPLIVIVAFLVLRRRKRKGTTTVTTERRFSEEKSGKSVEPAVEAAKEKMPAIYKKELQASSKKDAPDDGRDSIHTDRESSSSIRTEPLPRYEPKSNGGI